MHHRTICTAIVAMGLSLGAAQPAFAQDPIHKLGRGVVNVLTSWIEIPKQFSLGLQESNPMTGMLWGLLKGGAYTILRIDTGAYEAVTFPLPLPKGYVSPYYHMEIDDYAWE